MIANRYLNPDGNFDRLISGNVDHSSLHPIAISSNDAATSYAGGTSAGTPCRAVGVWKDRVCATYKSIDDASTREPPLPHTLRAFTLPSPIIIFLYIKYQFFSANLLPNNFSLRGGQNGFRSTATSIPFLEFNKKIKTIAALFPFFASTKSFLHSQGNIFAGFLVSQ